MSKSFGYVVALDQASIAAVPGEVIAIVGDNGAGKSTMVKVLSGIYPMDSGEIYFEGQRVSVNNPRDAQNLGIATVFQDLALVEALDVAANMYLGRPLKRSIFVDRRAMVEGAADLLRELRIRVPSVRVPVGSLSGGQRQGVAIARAILQRGRVILMDEPTAALGVRETQHVEEIDPGAAAERPGHHPREPRPGVRVPGRRRHPGAAPGQRRGASDGARRPPAKRSSASSPDCCA